MKKTITSRIEILLAKLAGQDVSLSTMAPGVPINLSEKLMLDIADRLDRIEQGGGSGSGGGKIVTIKQGLDPTSGNIEYVNLKTPKVGDVESNDVYAAYGGNEEAVELYMYDGDFNDFGSFDDIAIVQLCQYASGEIEDTAWYGGSGAVLSTYYFPLGPSPSGTAGYTSDVLVLTDVTPAIEVTGKINGDNIDIIIVPSNAPIATGTSDLDDGGGGGDVYD